MQQCVAMQCTCIYTCNSWESSLYSRCTCRCIDKEVHNIYMSSLPNIIIVVGVLRTPKRNFLEKHGTSYIYMSSLPNRFLETDENIEKCMCRGFESHLRQLIFSRKSDCLGCAVLLCLVCLFDLACFFLSSFSSLI